MDKKTLIIIVLLLLILSIQIFQLITVKKSSFGMSSQDDPCIANCWQSCNHDPQPRDCMMDCCRLDCENRCDI